MVKTVLQILAGLVGLAIVLVVALGLYLSSGKELEAWHAPSDFAEVFDYTNGTFEDYIAWSQRRLLASRVDSPSEEVINNLLPFVLEPEADCPVGPDGKVTNGIVLVHGLIASPWSMKHLGEYFQSRCFYVLSVLLPGHASRVGDMLDSTWEVWHREVAFATDILAQRAERLYLSGHSAGSTLSVLEAADNPGVDALILFAPAMQIAEASKFAGLISLVGKLFPAAAWFELEPEEAVYRYESFPFSAAAETWALIQETNRALAANPLDIPVLTVASVQDTTVNAQATLDFMQAQQNPLSFTLLYSQHELPTFNRTRIIDSSFPEQRLLSVGHLGLMTPPDHPHYGVNGDYRYCGHYYGSGTDGPGNDLYARCKAGERDFYGEATPENLQRGLIERIAFNPFYDDLLEEIDLFLDQVGMDTKGLPLQPPLPGANPPDLDN